MQPPSGGCVLKRVVQLVFVVEILQPPSGGCVLKHDIYEQLDPIFAAAFGRLCVET